MTEKIITQLVSLHGVQTFCLCPGGRCAPLISVISQTKGLKIFSFFEERSAGFFALGRSKRDHKPCAVITTSGTAVAELLPAVIEAYYSSVPLVLLTADRPSSYRGTGAPQSIEQAKIFSPYLENSWDLENNLNFDLSEWSRQAPCHINVCFDEPLIDQKINPLNFISQTQDGFLSDKNHRQEKGNIDQEKLKITSFFSKVKKPLCLLTDWPTNNFCHKESIEKLLHFFSWPLYAEALSGLRESKRLQPLLLKSGEEVLHWITLNKKIDGVIRIGRRPCARFWRDLENKYSHLPVLSVSDQVFPGLSRAHPVVSFSSFFEWANRDNQKKKTQTLPHLVSSHPQKIFKEIFEEDKKRVKKLRALLEKYPLSEPALIQKLSQKIPQYSILFLGNSLPIREWDLAADYQPDKQLKYISNRGANGIDGLLSTFFGQAEEEKENWCVIGDLSCLYDLQAPWILKQLSKKAQYFLVIINNGGGRIFEPLFSDPVFLNKHNLQFKKWAEMWGFHYYLIHEWPNQVAFASPAVIELKVDPKNTKQFRSEAIQS